MHDLHQKFCLNYQTKTKQDVSSSISLNGFPSLFFPNGCLYLYICIHHPSLLSFLYQYVRNTYRQNKLFQPHTFHDSIHLLRNLLKSFFLCNLIYTCKFHPNETKFEMFRLVNIYH